MNPILISVGVLVVGILLGIWLYRAEIWPSHVDSADRGTLHYVRAVTATAFSRFFEMADEKTVREVIARMLNWLGLQYAILDSDRKMLKVSPDSMQCKEAVELQQAFVADLRSQIDFMVALAMLHGFGKVVHKEVARPLPRPPSAEVEHFLFES